MKKWIPWIIPAIGLIILAKALVPRAPETDVDLSTFAALPVKEYGRVKPIDTVARSALMKLRGKQSLRDENGAKTSAIEWFARVLLAPETSFGDRVFRIDHPQVLTLLGFGGSERKYFSYADIVPKLAEIQRQARLINAETGERDAYQRAVMKLFEQVILYQQWTLSLRPQHVDGSVAAHYEAYLSAGTTAASELTKRRAGQPHDAAAIDRFMSFGRQFNDMVQTSMLSVPVPGDAGHAWKSMGETLVGAAAASSLDPVAMSYARLADAWAAGDDAAFQAAATALQQTLHERIGREGARVGFEHYFNQVQPFYVSMQLYVLLFMVAITSWLVWDKPLVQGALRLLVITVIAHSFGLFARMWIQELPPVTNLYSSAIFVGWAAAALCILLERWFANGVGSAAAAVCGFLSLLVAHHLSTGGDTMEVMRAVLDSNFWLTTHVITITLGYSATFLAGFLGIVYVIRGMLTRGLDATTERALRRMTFGILCFALLFSFVGTVLGGIWADQSWGRFWGWDPKENGALMIVLWIAMQLHALRAHMCGPRGFMLLSIGGNIITSWSWFGTNMLGVGLHSYGFMDQAFVWLLAFWLSQLILIIIAWAIPLRMWRSPAVSALATPVR